uniref:Saposin B-type domain-containing protein n=1 Tax=Globodera pallida TaxID=36090 RepID=A0A183CGU5_GLOPA
MNLAVSVVKCRMKLFQAITIQVLQDIFDVSTVNCCERLFEIVERCDWCNFGGLQFVREILGAAKVLCKPKFAHRIQRVQKLP